MALVIVKIKKIGKKTESKKIVENKEDINKIKSEVINPVDHRSIII